LLQHCLHVVAAAVDYICEEHNNPPDFFLDVLNGSVGVTATDETLLPNGELESVIANGTL